MQTPQPGQEKYSRRANPFRADRIRIPAFRIGIRSISVGMCMYRVNGSTTMKMPRAIE